MSEQDYSSNFRFPSVPSVRSRELPFLAPAPRAVPWAIQWQLFGGRVFCAVGLLFVGVSSVLLALFWSEARGRLVHLGQLFPLLHLSMGLGLTIVPICLWRRKVAIMKHGQLAPARLVAAQARGHWVRQSDGSMADVGGPWIDYEQAFEQVRALRATQLNVPPGFSTMVPFMGCMIAAFGLFALATALLAVAGIWFGRNQLEPAEKLLATMGILTFLAVLLGVALLIRSSVLRMRRLKNREITPAALGLKVVDRCRFVFALPDGHEVEVTANVDLRSRLEKGDAEPDDVAIYLADAPRRTLLLGGLSPPVTIWNEQWVQQLEEAP
jgi:hypothetical protein